MISGVEIVRLLKSVFVPNEVLERVEDVNFRQLYTKGYRVVFLDIDNTVMTYEQKNLSLQKISWIEKIKSLGFQVFFVSNNINGRRVNRVCTQTGVEGIYFSCKPLVMSVKALAKDNFIDFREVVMIGDQILTDIIMGNWLKCYTVLVDPLGKRLSFLKTLQRDIELFLLRKLKF